MRRGRPCRFADLDPHAQARGRDDRPRARRHDPRLALCQAGGVRRFVQTSSVAAIAYGRDEKSYRVDESAWTDITHPDVTPYAKSKTIAERAARGWMFANGGTMEFVSVNPALVLGPIETPDFSPRWWR